MRFCFSEKNMIVITIEIAKKLERIVVMEGC